MKIVMGMNVPYTRSHGGANRSNRALLEGLAARGHEVTVVTPALSSPSSMTYEQWHAQMTASGIALGRDGGLDILRLHGVSVLAIREQGQVRPVLHDAVRRLDPDWTLIASEDPSQSLLAGALQAEQGRVAYMALTPQLFPFGPESLYPGTDRTDLVRRCQLVCCLSQWTARYIRQHAGIAAEVYHPPHFGRGPWPQLGEFEDGSILLMNASAVKGLGIFLELARLFPRTPFAVVPG
jgi:hypothetical protein